MTDAPTILVPVDLSELTSVVLDEAIDLAKPLKAELQVLHVVQPRHPVVAGGGPPTTVLSTPSDDEIEAARREVEHLALKVCERGVPAKARLKQGAVIDEILSSAEETGARFVLLGHHGKGLMRRALMGSTSRAVLDASRVPTILVPPPDPAR